MDYYVLKLFFVLGAILYGMGSLWLRDDHMDELREIQDPVWEIVEWLSFLPPLDFLE